MSDFEIHVRFYAWREGTKTFHTHETTGRWLIEDDVLYVEFRFNLVPKFLFPIFGMEYKYETFIPECDILEIHVDETLIGSETNCGIMTGQWYFNGKEKVFSIKRGKESIWWKEREFGIIQKCSL